MSLKECWYGQNSFCIDCSSVCNLKGMKSLVNGGIATLLSNVIKRKLGQIIWNVYLQFIILFQNLERKTMGI